MYSLHLNHNYYSSYILVKSDMFRIFITHTKYVLVESYKLNVNKTLNLESYQRQMILKILWYILRRYVDLSLDSVHFPFLNRSLKKFGYYQMQGISEIA